MENAHPAMSNDRGWAIKNVLKADFQYIHLRLHFAHHLCENFL